MSMACLNKAVILKKHTPIYRTYYDIETPFYALQKTLNLKEEEV
jgi:hypothetical protein